MPLRSKTPTVAAPFSGLGFDLTGTALKADDTRLLQRHEEHGFFMPPPTAPERDRWGFELMLFLGRETGGS